MKRRGPIPEEDRCKAVWPGSEAGQCVFRAGHRKMHKDASDGWWSDDQAEERAAEILKEVMDS